ncbi:Pentatricopeptide repeat-containing protein [Prunus dulcis]|uniref:Pentatricopeptide repeat-containing protein n=1 Tax=Prunus dulcis TaxID=3755 RepID=A0A4Y1QX85_PRUDU|nr:Pentatricopeptide repeat-containing protein [Prunus dulcis]
MPPQSPPPKPQNFTFFHGHRKPHRTALQSAAASSPTASPSQTRRYPPPPPNLSPSNSPNGIHTSPILAVHFIIQPCRHDTPLISLPIARFILDAFRKNRNHWGPPVVSELRKLRRVTPDLVAEVLKVQNDPVSASKFFHWAGKQKGFKHTYASYNALAYCLNRSNRFRSADQVPELMDSQGKPPSEKQFEILIRMHSDANRGLRVYYVYEKMKKFGVKPRVFLYNRIMDALVKSGYLDLALSVYEDFRGDGLVEESVTFMILIKGLCKMGRMDEMLQLLER